MKNILVAVITFLIIGCASKKEVNSTDIESSLISKGILGGAGAEGIEKQNLVITDAKTWQDLMAKMNSVNNVSEHFSETDIDFSKFTVIAVFESVKNSGGFELDLKVTSDTETVLAEVIKSGPEKGGFVTTVMTQPYYIIKIPKTDLPIVFQ